MPRTYIPSRTKPYKKYDTDHIHAAIQEYESSNNKSLKDIGIKYNISKSVLHRHMTRVMRSHGGQRVLTNDTEEYIIEYINICSEWGYPLDVYDLRILIKGYLDRMDVQVKRFKNNMPGPDFVECFLKRHRDVISRRISQNIKRARAAVSPEVIENYFIHLKTSLEGIPLSNIVNYDETNLSDDPGKKKIITKRGVKYPERVMNHSKSSTSLMIAASADGTLLPGYVVYKSAHLYDTWTKNGPRHCRYNRTTSGWFDSNTFQDWVETVALPYFQNKEGRKVLIGDNLSSHLSIDLIRKCKEKDVYFVFLPANSTHLTQPLDVAFFRPMKSAWRDILFTWKKTEGRTQASVPKNSFPRLLKKLFERLDTNVKNNVLAGFIKTGISPLNKIKVLERLPCSSTRNETCTDAERKAIGDAVVKLLSEMRYGNGNTENNKPNNKKKKLNVQAGKSVGEDSDYSESETLETTSRINEDASESQNADDLETNIKTNVINIKRKPKPKEAEVKQVKGKGTGKKSKKQEKNSNDTEGVAKKNIDDKTVNKNDGNNTFYIEREGIKSSETNSETATINQEEQNETLRKAVEETEKIKKLRSASIQKNEEMTLQELENFNLRELDIDNMPIILEDCISISENITIENDNKEILILEDENQTKNTITINDEHCFQLYPRPHDKENINSKAEQIQHKKVSLKRKNKELKNLKFKDQDTINTEHPTQSKIKKVNILSNVPVVINKWDATKIYRRVPTSVQVPIKKCANAGPSHKNKTYYKIESDILKDLMDDDI